MARLPRRVLAGHAHLVEQRSHGGRTVFVDDADRARYLQALRDAAAAQALTVHAYALGDDGVRLLVTPPQADALGRAMQAVGRTYVSAYNRRHGQRGTIWEGRFRCCVVEAGPACLAALRWVDGQVGATSATHRTGGARQTWLADTPEYWALGNTPFDREVVYRTLLVQGLPALEGARFAKAVASGWAVGSEAFAAQAAAEVGAPLRPRPRGRPRRA
jgi:putative transposase